MSDLSYLDDVTATGSIIQDVKTKVAKMKELQMDMIAKEAAYEEAKKEYEHYKATVVVASMVSAGVHNLEDADGNFIRLESKYYCNPNKNDADRLIIEKWLIEQKLDHLLKHKGEVSAEQFENLKANGIPYADKTDVNTNSLKSALKDLLGYTPGSMARIALSDIPDCIHFVVQQEVVVG